MSLDLVVICVGLVVGRGILGQLGGGLSTQGGVAATWGLVAALGGPAITQAPASFILVSLWASSILTLQLTTAHTTSSLLRGLFLVFISAGGMLTSVDAVSLVFFFELMLGGAVILLRVTLKGDRGVEALCELLAWALFGSFCLLLGVASLYTSGLNTCTSSLFGLGFGVKVPVWPCLSWLLRAHVEASTEFSIFLSGLLVKFGALALQKLRYLLGVGFDPVLLSLAWVGMVEAVLRIGAQVDLKRIVALLTVVESNWLVLSLSLGGEICLGVGWSLAVVHGWATTLEFFAVELVYRRLGTRFYPKVSGLYNSLPQLWRLLTASLLVSLGQPGTALFSLKLIFLSELSQINTTLFLSIAVLLLLLLPCLLIRVWLPILFGQGSSHSWGSDITRQEVSVVSVPLFGLIICAWLPAVLM